MVPHPRFNDEPTPSLTFPYEISAISTGYPHSLLKTKTLAGASKARGM
jgi:hypothetical protein